MKFSVKNLLLFVTMVAVALGAEVGLGLGSALLRFAQLPDQVTIFTFLVALVLPFVLPTVSESKPKNIWIPLGIGGCISMVVFVTVVMKWESGGPFAGMANVFNLVFGLTVSIFLWSSITILVSCVPSWRSMANYVVWVPIVLAISLGFIYAVC